MVLTGDSFGCTAKVVLNFRGSKGEWKLDRNVRYPQLDENQYADYLNIRGRLYNLYHVRRRWPRQVRRLLKAYLRADAHARRLALDECRVLQLPKIFRGQIGPGLGDVQRDRVATAFKEIFG